jgi:hypothetical protein
MVSETGQFSTHWFPMYGTFFADPNIAFIAQSASSPNAKHSATGDAFQGQMFSRSISQ